MLYSLHCYNLHVIVIQKCFKNLHATCFENFWTRHLSQSDLDTVSSKPISVHLLVEDQYLKILILSICNVHNNNGVGIC